MANKKANIDYNLIITGAMIFGVFYFGRNILENLGLVSDRKESNDLLQLNNEDYFSPNYWQRKLPAKIITESFSRKYSDDIYNAYGYFNDDENVIYGVFEQMKTKSQVSYLAYKFNQYYNRSLIEYLRSFLNDSEMAKIAAIINKLPAYMD
jgi:hypothetical protein